MEAENKKSQLEAMACNWLQSRNLWLWDLKIYESLKIRKEARLQRNRQAIASKAQS